MLIQSVSVLVVLVLVSLPINILVLAAAVWLQREPLEEEKLSVGEFWLHAAIGGAGLTVLTPLFSIPAVFGLSGSFGFILAAFVIFPAGCLWLLWVYSVDFGEAAMLMLVYLALPVILAIILASLPLQTT